MVMLRAEPQIQSVEVVDVLPVVTIGHQALIACSGKMNYLERGMMK